jgi:predicted DsbA family dithiol-disulfide isomerase
MMQFFKSCFRIMAKPKKRITVFSDYICPFCYIGDLRLAKLAKGTAFDIDWRFMEIHPDTPAEGMALSELGYPQEHWDMLMTNLQRMARQEKVTLADRKFTTNSHKAMLLAEAARQREPEAFKKLHPRLFEAYFVEEQNIGDEVVLKKLAAESGVSEATVSAAWTDEAYEKKLRENLEAAAMLEITGTPTFVYEDQILSGAVPTGMLAELLVEYEGPT